MRSVQPGLWIKLKFALFSGGIKVPDLLRFSYTLSKNWFVAKMLDMGCVVRGGLGAELLKLHMSESLGFFCN